MMATSAIRVRAVNVAPQRSRGDYVLYWMTAQRRRGHNFGLQRAVEQAAARRLPLVILEALRVGYPWASDRLHGFVLDGMHANQRAFSDGAAFYYPYVERAAGEGSGLLCALAERAALVVADYFPCFFLPRMLTAAARKLDVCLEAVDGNGLLPIAAAPTDFATAYAFRRHLQRELGPHLVERPLPDALAAVRLPRLDALPRAITRRWPAADPALLSREPSALGALPIDHAVGVTGLRGGSEAGAAVLRQFLDDKLAAYGEGRNHPDEDAGSGLSPYLHFGHIGAHEVFHHLAEAQAWKPDRLARTGRGQREGWWGMDASAEAFLDELVTWRELGYNHCARHPHSYDRYETLPAWARRTLEAHERDRRQYRYTLAELAGARTHDPLWNAAQTELVTEGRMHNYLRMLWGKKVLEWSESPRVALAHLIELNNRYALDGRDPNSYSGICWTLGLYDRPWAPERAIFGQVRYMSSTNTLKKLRCRAYLARYG